MIEAMGGQCVHCPETSFLQFHCKERRGGEHHRLQWEARIRFYWLEFGKGNLELLCPACHTRQTLLENSKAKALHTILGLTPTAVEIPSKHGRP